MKVVLKRLPLLVIFFYILLFYLLLVLMPFQNILLDLLVLEFLLQFTRCIFL